MFCLIFNTKVVHHQDEIYWVRLVHPEAGSDLDWLVPMRFYMFEHIYVENVDGLWEAIHPHLHFGVYVAVVYFPLKVGFIHELFRDHYDINTDPLGVGHAHV